MTALSLAVRNTLAQDTTITALLAQSASWSTWIFDKKPIGANFENNGKCLIVVNEGDPWTSMNEHNRLEFPTVIVDIWADADRNENRSLALDNAKDKIKVIARRVDRHLHRVDAGGPGGGYIIWGTAAQVASKTGVLVTESKRASGPSFSPISDAEGAWMGRYIYNVNAA